VLNALFSSSEKRFKAEIARLEAFLSAFPGEYCGFAADGHVIASPGFYNLLQISRVTSLADILACLPVNDAAVLESLMARFQDEGTAFSMLVSPAANPNRKYRLHMTRGSATTGDAKMPVERFDLLWVEDITDAHSIQTGLERQLSQLQIERERLEAALDTLPVQLSIRAEDGRLLWVNDSYAHALDKGRNEVVEANLDLPMKAGKGEADAKTLAAASLKENAPQARQGHAVIRGERRLLKITETPISTLGMTVGLAQDITREEELESASRRQVEAYRNMLEHLQAAIAIFGRDEKLEFFNSAFTHMWQLDDQWMHTSPRLGDILERLRELRRLPEQADFRSYKASWLAMFTNLIAPHQDMLYLPDGTVLRLLVIPHPLGGLMMLFEDVTSRLEMEASYNTLVAVQKETLDNLTEGVAVYGGDGRLKLFNPAFARLWNLPAEILQGEPHITRVVDRTKALFRTEDWDDVRHTLLAHGLDRNDGEAVFRLANAKIYAAASRALPDGGSLVTHIDVTDTVNIQDALAAKTAALEEAEQVKASFLANVSYQLRTPLNAIIGFNELLDQEFFGPLNNRQKEYTAGMREAGSRLQHLIDALLDLTTMEAGFFTLNTDDVAVWEVVADVHDLSLEWAQAGGQSIDMHIAKDAGRMQADAPRIKQALLHLIQHAMSITPKGGKISLSAERIAKPAKGLQGVVISVTDSGQELSEDAQDALFKPFGQVGPRKAGGFAEGDNFSANGVGLSLVKRIAELHGGHMQVSSSPTGTTIKLVL
jgi:signal transduction histidine kinase